jgi:3,4-dehydroadipyl-CoA semialdehyde dehydrogenase
MILESFVSGRWAAGKGDGRALVNPATGEEIARASADGIDMVSALDHARNQGGTALCDLSFAERGDILKAIAGVLQANRDAYFQTARGNSGNTAADASIDVDGGIGTLKYYARLGGLLGSGKYLIEDGQDQLARDPVFFSRHVQTSRPGVAVQINAFNFPSWGMWEKIAVATLAGVPSLSKPATATALLSWQMMKDVISAGVVPDGVLSLICGSGEAIADQLGPMDSISFTGSAATGRMFRQMLAARMAAPRLTVEADSVNSTILGRDATPGSEIFDLAVREVVKALSVKAGQLCTNIRRIFVHSSVASAFADAVAAKVSTLTVGDPANESTRVGPLINRAQRDEALSNIARLQTESTVVAQARLEAMPEKSGFVAPTLLICSKPEEARAVHEIEVFGPCATILPYDSLDQAVAFAVRGEGSLALSLFSDDRDEQMKIVVRLGAWHGRILLVDSDAGKAHTGHAIVMPQCVHGGPGRAGGGEELGGFRGLGFHMQRTAIQGSSAAFAGIAGDAAQIST